MLAQCDKNATCFKKYTSSMWKHRYTFRAVHLPAMDGRNCFPWKQGKFFYMPSQHDRTNHILQTVRFLRCEATRNCVSSGSFTTLAVITHKVCSPLIQSNIFDMPSLLNDKQCRMIHQVRLLGHDKTGTHSLVGHKDSAGNTDGRPTKGRGRLTDGNQEKQRCNERAGSTDGRHGLKADGPWSYRYVTIFNRSPLRSSSHMRSFTNDMKRNARRSRRSTYRIQESWRPQIHHAQKACSIQPAGIRIQPIIQQRFANLELG